MRDMVQTKPSLTQLATSRSYYPLYCPVGSTQLGRGGNRSQSNSQRPPSITSARPSDSFPETGAFILACGTLAACGGTPSPSPASGTGRTAASPAVIASIPVGRGPTLLAMSPDGSTVYAASVGKLFAIRTASNTVAATAGIDQYTTGLAVTPNGASVLSIATTSSSLAVLPAPALAGGRSIGLPQGLYPGGYGQIAVSADGRWAWVVNEARWIAGADLGAGTARQVQLDMRPRDVALSADGQTIYLAGCKYYCTTGSLASVDRTATRPRRPAAGTAAAAAVAMEPPSKTNKT